MGISQVVVVQVSLQKYEVSAVCNPLTSSLFLNNYLAARKTDTTTSSVGSKDTSSITSAITSHTPGTVSSELPPANSSPTIAALPPETSSKKAGKVLD
jgi:hypothetical protein